MRMRRITCVNPQIHFLRISHSFTYTLTFLRRSHTLFQTQTQTYSHAHFCVTMRQVLLLSLKHRLARGRKNVAALTPRYARSKLDRSITTIHLPSVPQNALGFCAYTKKV